MTPRVLDLDGLVLERGSHPANDGLCVMEAVAFVAGEPHTDSPACACPIISAFCRRWNDDLDDAGRQRLKPYIPKLVGTRATPTVKERRGWLIADWLLRVHIPAWLRLAKLDEQADALECLPPIVDLGTFKASRPTLAAAWAASRAAAGDAAGDAARAAAGDAARDAARDAAWAASRAAAGDAARDAAWHVARDAARDAAWAAGGDAARDAAWAASRAAAGDAAGDAARAAAGAALEPTKLSLQESAFDLLTRLIETREP